LELGFNFFMYVLVGFAAQLIDGALGMAYGVSCTSFLLSIGIPTAQASASVHSAEVVTTLFSGISHYKLGNVDKKLFFSLVLPGVLGGITGAYLLTHIHGAMLKPFVSAYLLVMGIRILVKAFRKTNTEKPIHENPLRLLGLLGGIFDAIGGGGWGPIVTSTLVANGSEARKTIGTVNAAEFFVTLAQVITFSVFITISTWKLILGLMLGGVIASPLAASICKKIDPKRLMIVVGTFIILLSIRTITLSISF